MNFTQQQLLTWLNSTKNNSRIIITDKNFCQHQLKQRVAILTTENPPLVLTFKQWLCFLLQNNPNRKSFLLNDFKAKYFFKEGDKFFSLYQKLNRHNFLPWQTTWPEHFFCKFDLNKIIEYESKMNDRLDYALLLNNLLATKKTQKNCSILLATNKPFTNKELELLSSNALKISCLVNNKHPAKLTHVEYPDAISEIHKTVKEVISYYKQHPKHIIAIVTNSYKHSNIVYQQLKNIDSSNLINYTIHSSPDSLDNQQIIKKALWLLDQIAGSKLQIDIWVQYFANNQLLLSENNTKHRVMLKFLLKNHQSDLTWSNIEKLNIKPLEDFYQRLIYCKRLLTNSAKDNLYAWSIKFEKILSCWHWLGSFKLSSEQIEVLTTWQKSWDNWSTLTEKQISYEQALLLLKKSCKSTSFQQSQNIKNPVLYIINHQELASGFYDKVWAIGMNTDSWPISEKIEIMLPKNLNDNLNAFNNLYQQLQIRNLKHSSSVLQTSHCSMIDNTTKYMANFLTASINLSDNFNLYTQILNKELDIYEEQYIYKNNTISASLLKDVNSCAFKALAKHIFKLQPLEKKETDISPRIRGLIIHDSLATIWGNLQNQANLIAFDTLDLEKLVRKICQKNIHKYSSQYNWPLDEKQTSFQIKFFTTKILELLELEKQRPAFSVQSIEYATNITIDNSVINLRLDRIDQCENELVIIDYKTGNVSINEWLGERPDNPQMLLYLLSIKPQPAALVYAVINNKKIKFTGISNFDWPKDNSTETIDSLIPIWQLNIENSVKQAKTMRALINPKNKESCNNCTVKKLCRISEIKNEHFR